MPFQIHFTAGARNDLASIYSYIADHDSKAHADQVIQGILQAALSLKKIPERGNYPPELVQVEIRAYRQVFFKPYRIIYRISGREVFVLLIADGRRNLASVLLRRLHEG